MGMKIFEDGPIRAMKASYQELFDLRNALVRLFNLLLFRSYALNLVDLESKLNRNTEKELI
jgi:hypothetical protein